MWSGCSVSCCFSPLTAAVGAIGLYSRWFALTMSSTTDALEISLERNCAGALRFLPSLLPRWLYDAIERGLIPERAAL